MCGSELLDGAGKEKEKKFLISCRDPFSEVRIYNLGSPKTLSSPFRQGVDRKGALSLEDSRVQQKKLLLPAHMWFLGNPIWTGKY